MKGVHPRDMWLLNYSDYNEYVTYTYYITQKLNVDITHHGVALNNLFIIKAWKKKQFNYFQLNLSVSVIAESHEMLDSTDYHC